MEWAGTHCDSKRAGSACPYPTGDYRLVTPTSWLRQGSLKKLGRLNDFGIFPQ